ncbi:MAG: hypothetical protein ACFFD4_23295 [Candidatus Odinarchaeota archaeon]
MTGLKKCRFTGTTSFICERINRKVFDDWFKFLEDYKVYESTCYHMDKALMHHMASYRRKIHRKFAFSKYEDGTGFKSVVIPKICTLLIEDNNGSSSLCNCVSPSVINEWNHFIKESNLNGKSAYHLEIALNNYMDEWLRTPF